MEELSKIPSHVAVIMDGNGRWAEARGLPRSEGHKAGAEPVRATLSQAIRLGIKNLTLYTFSTENWFRSQEEINNLFGLLTRYLNSETQELFEKGVRLNAVGDLDRLPPENLAALKKTMDVTKSNDAITLTLALSYGARAELAAAASALSRKVISGELRIEDLDEKAFEKELWSSKLPDVDLLIRTGGDKRISNFLLWKIAYAELHFTNTLWPDFSEKDFEEAVEDFQSRQRRFGKA
jgi:undecaprenyl diphosphate synthase